MQLGFGFQQQSTALPQRSLQIGSHVAVSILGGEKVPFAGGKEPDDPNLRAIANAYVGRSIGRSADGPIVYFVTLVGASACRVVRSVAPLLLTFADVRTDACCGCVVRFFTCVFVGLCVCLCVCPRACVCVDVVVLCEFDEQRNEMTAGGRAQLTGCMITTSS